jgi:beta-1,4-N-acetylglucosaminyltransferase
MRETITEEKNNADKGSCKLCLVCSSGGHFMRLYQLKEWWQSYDRFWISFKKLDAVSLLKDEKVYWANYPTNRNLKNLIWNAFLAIKILRKERPKIIASSGAGIAVPFFYIGRFFGCKLIYIESYARVNSPTITGKLVYPITDAFILQWDEQKRFYPKGIVLGQLV